MARSTRSDYAKCTVWTPTVKAEIEGPRLACAIELFRSLDTSHMQKALEKMHAIKTSREERESATSKE